MKNNLLRLSGSFLLLVLLTLFIPGCAVIGGIFKAGVWVGVLAVLVIIGIILFIVSKASGRK